MSDLFSSLSLASRALEAQRMGLNVTGQNIANVNTPGYSRRVADFVALPPDMPRSAGRGVDVAAIRAVRDRLIEQRLQQEVPAERREGALAEILSLLESALGESGSSLDKNLNEFFGAFSSLSDNPTSAVARHEVQVQGEALAFSFRDVSARIVRSQRDADGRIRAAVEEVNNLTTRIAALNRSIGEASPSQGSLHQQDEQTVLIRRLMEIVDIDVLTRANGGVDITFGNGRALVEGEFSFSLDTASTPPFGFAALKTGGLDVTVEVTGGQLGGLLAARDVHVPDYLNRLDTIAFEVASQVNALHTSGFDQLGNAGGNFFSFTAPPVGVSGAARSIIVAPAVAADTRLIAAAGVALVGDNTIATGIARLRDALVLEGGSATFADGWSRLVYRVGRDTQTAADGQSGRAEIVRQVDAFRDEVSGISLDEEAMHMLKYQRAYEASARFFRTIDEAIEVLLQTVAR